MESTQNTFGLAKGKQTNKHGQPSSNKEQSEDSTMALVYPDGRVMNVEVHQKDH